MDRSVTARPALDHRPEPKLAGPISARIRALRPSLSPTAARIGDAVLAAPAEIVSLTVTDLADRTGTSVGSVVRFCQDIDLKGFHDLKLRLAAESATPATARPHTDSAPANTIETVLRSAVTGLEQLPATLEHATLLRIARELRRAARVLVAGVGSSAPIAMDAGHRLRTLGVHTEVLTDPHQQHLAARMLGTDCCCLAISHTGQTQETLTALRAARDAGALTIGLTSYHRSPFTELCNQAIVAGATELHGLEATASRLVHLAVIDVLVALVTDLDPAAAAQAEQLYTDAVAAHRV
ncbi:MurR/RpiR family transcriptional regulator [Prauserella halophila]|uniref:MurR/RpiR family transcriptional regulator n=1 Tax=Prauserella halophila TaxID=185641 RepID=A0ABP4H4H5_9PSEU|nr:MurR/RpiR family transcriptional regulator [Prauserella halophila]MCP2238224.1 transcriptional regulator, RpiR family [Prauserella halophila]